MIILRNTAEILTILPLATSKYIRSIMGDESLSLSWVQPEFTALYVGDYIEYKGVNFKLNKLPNIKKVAANRWEYTAIFQAPVYDLLKANYLLLDNTSVPPQGEFSLVGNAATFITLLVANLNRVFGSGQWFVGDVDDTVYVTLSFNNESCYNVLSRLADEFKTEFCVSGNTIHLTKVSRDTDLTLQYGSTLYDIERVSVDSQNVITRLYVFGSDKNISSSYRSGSKRLLIPSPDLYLEQNVESYGVIESFVTFDEIYPRLGATSAGTVTAIGENVLTFTDSNLDFDVNTHLIPGTSAKVQFLTGQCAGYPMQISHFANSDKTFILIANTDDKNYSVPNETIYPAVGDKYVLLDISMPDSYITAAETELKNKALDYLDKNSSPKVTYRVNFSAIFAKTNAPDLRVGDNVTTVDTDFGENMQIRVTKLTSGIEDNFNVEIELSDTIVKSTLNRINAAVEQAAIGVKEVGTDLKQKFNFSYRNMKELQALVFDPDGYFNTETIKPLSIDTQMLAVGSNSQQFQTDVVFTPNNGGSYHNFAWSAGSLTHFTIYADAIKTWNISSGSITGITDDRFPSYIYAKCSRTTSAGTIELNTQGLAYDSDPDYYYFLVGVLHTPVSGVCGLSLTYGQTIVNGQFIKTGVISSMNGASYFDLNTGEIKISNFDGPYKVEITREVLPELSIFENSIIHSIIIDGGGSKQASYTFTSEIPDPLVLELSLGSDSHQFDIDTPSVVNILVAAGNEYLGSMTYTSKSVDRYIRVINVNTNDILIQNIENPSGDIVISKSFFVGVGSYKIEAYYKITFTGASAPVGTTISFAIGWDDSLNKYTNLLKSTNIGVNGVSVFDSINKRYVYISTDDQDFIMRILGGCNIQSSNTQNAIKVTNEAIEFIGIQTGSTGLTSGQIYKDSSGNLKIV